MMNYTFGILTVSDRCFAGQTLDESGPEIRIMLQNVFGVSEITQKTVPDEQDQIEKCLKQFSDDLKLNCVFTTGGTGFAKRDITPEATKNVIHKEAPQLSLAMSLESFNKTKFAALSRAICGIRGNTIIVNLPGSKKAVIECFQAIKDVIPHAIDLILDQKTVVSSLHSSMKDDTNSLETNFNDIKQHIHVCPHKTASGTDKDDRSSTYPMLDIDVALNIIYDTVQRGSTSEIIYSPMNCPPFRASIKDGYAIKSGSSVFKRKIIGYVSAGDQISRQDFQYNECFKINTGAPLPEFADTIIQVEDTKLLQQDENGVETEIELKTIPPKNTDVRQIGSDLKEKAVLFTKSGMFGVPEKTLMASVGILDSDKTLPRVGIISTGDELIAPGEKLEEGQIYDSNTTMLKHLLEKFNFQVSFCAIAKDTYDSLKETVALALKTCDVVISSGGVSMGDKDYVPAVIKDLDFNIHFGRVNMKPGKPMTFGYEKKNNKSFFGLPGNPVSSFVTFHVFVLPTLRYMSGFIDAKCKLPEINVTLDLDKYVLDPRPEFVRATIVSRKGILYASINGDQISSRVKSLVNSDVLLHLPGKSDKVSLVTKGCKLKASILNHDFISKYEN